MNRREFIHASAASLLLSSVAGFEARGGAAQIDEADKAFARTNVERRSWTIGNTLVERGIHFDAKQGLYTAGWW